MRQACSSLCSLQATGVRLNESGKNRRKHSFPVTEAAKVSHPNYGGIANFGFMLLFPQRERCNTIRGTLHLNLCHNEDYRLLCVLGLQGAGQVRKQTLATHACVVTCSTEKAVMTQAGAAKTKGVYSL